MLVKNDCRVCKERLLMVAGTIIAHVFTEEARPLYNLEGIWRSTSASIQQYRDAVPLHSGANFAGGSAFVMAMESAK